jgi:hypothetical protein
MVAGELNKNAGFIGMEDEMDETREWDIIGNMFIG